MSVLSATAQEQVEETLVRNGLLTRKSLDSLKAKAKTDNTPLLGLLVSDGHISDEDDSTRNQGAVRKPGNDACRNQGA